MLLRAATFVFLIMLFFPTIVVASCQCVCYDTAQRLNPSKLVIMVDSKACFDGCAAGNPGKQVYYDCFDTVNGGDQILGGNIRSACLENGNCDVNDFVWLGVNISKWILGIVGSLTLLMFIYGGVTWMLSMGDPAKVTKGKGVLLAAITGIVIVFSSYIFIKFFMSTMGLNWNGTNQQPVPEPVPDTFVGPPAPN